MKAGLTTWSAMGNLAGNVLLIANSDPDEQGQRLLDLLVSITSPAALHFMGGPEWRPRLQAAGITDDRILYAVDPNGKPLELNYFIDTSSAASWVLGKQCVYFIGSSAHSIHNDEVKDIFERSVCRLIGDGTFLAHTLPEPYVFRLDLVDLARRLDRETSLSAYRRDTDAAVSALYEEWERLGRPDRQDEAFDRSNEILVRHLPPWLGQESDTVPEPDDESLRHAIRQLGMQTRALQAQNLDAGDRLFRQATAAHAEQMGQLLALHEQMRQAHAEQTSQLLASYEQMRQAHEKRVAELTASYEDRIEAVAVRDRIIEELRNQSLGERLVGWWRSRKKP